MSQAVMSAVNVSEVATKAIEHGATVEQTLGVLDSLKMHILPFDGDDAYLAASLRPLTAPAGLSLGDRCCLALGKRLGAPIYTADGGWRGLEDTVKLELVFIR
jgi:PIN domain nuclease of toxin-antitoxin system